MLVMFLPTGRASGHGLVSRSHVRLSDDHSFFRRVTDCLDAVAVGIDYKSRIVVGVILRAQTGASVVGECCSVKLTDGRTIRCAEAQMHAPQGKTPVSTVIVNSTPNWPAIAP